MTVLWEFWNASLLHLFAWRRSGQIRIYGPATLLLSRPSNKAASYDAISFNDPINRLIFETPEGEVASDFEDKVREYFDEQVIFNSTAENVKDWSWNYDAIKSLNGNKRI